MTEPEKASVPYPRALELHPTVRQSLLATFDACALSARFHLDHELGWDTIPQGRGTIFHRFAARALEEMARQGERSIPTDVALAILRETLRQADVAPEEVVNIPRRHIKDLRWTVIKFAHELEFDIEHLADVEQQIVAPVLYEDPEGGWVERVVTGTLDALFLPDPEWAVVIDWKDMWAVPPESELSEKGYFQQQLYAHHVMRRFRTVQRVTLREAYVRKGKFREATVFRSDLENIAEELGALVERFDRAVEEGVWPLADGEAPKLWTPSPGSHCSYCPRPAACPIFPDARAEGAISSPEMAERYAAEATVAKAVLGQRNKALRAYTRAHGPTRVKNAKDPHRVVGYKEVSRTERPDKKRLERALRANGADVDLDKLYPKKTSDRFDEFTHEPVSDEAIDAELEAALEESVARTAPK